MAVWDCGELLWTAAVIPGVGLASLRSAIAWDAHVKFRLLLETPRPDEWDMASVWERRSRRWRGIGLVTFAVSILLFVAWIVGRTIF